MSAKTDDYGWDGATPESTSYLGPPILAIARGCDAHRVLDAGCGNGSIAAMLARNGFEVTGVDGDAAGIELARRNHPHAHFETVDFADSGSDVGGGRFDLVVSTEVVEHLYAPHELPRFVFEALRPGGTFAITTPYHGYLKNLALSLANKWDHHHTALWHGGHVKFWSRATLTKLLEDAGFVVDAFQGIGRAPFLWKSMMLVAHKPA